MRPGSSAFRAGMEAADMLIDHFVMPDHRSSRPNYTREINRWGSDREGRQSFRDRARTSLFAPDIFAHPLTRLFGYLWRFGLVALVGALV